MLSITPTQVSTMNLQEPTTGQPEDASKQAAVDGAETVATSQPSSTVTLSVAAQALAAVTQAGLLKDGKAETQIVKTAVDNLDTQDTAKRPRKKSELEKMLQKTSLLELLDRWSAQREVAKKGGGANAEELKQKLKNMEQLKDLL